MPSSFAPRNSRRLGRTTANSRLRAPSGRPHSSAGTRLATTGVDASITSTGLKTTEDLTSDEQVGYNIVLRACKSPIRQIVENAGEDGNVVASEIEARTGYETRVTILGHVQRGGTPTAFDRVLSTRFGIGAIDAVHDGAWGMMVALQANEIVRVPSNVKSTAIVRARAPDRNNNPQRSRRTTDDNHPGRIR